MARLTCKCPKCGRLLTQSGELNLGDVAVPTFQCDECLVTQTFMGEEMEMALTFALDDKGQPFDPAEPDGRLRF